MENTKVFSKEYNALSQIEEMRVELDTFLYRASHDLKGPLARMEGLLALMKSYESGPDMKFSIKLIESLTLEMNGVINNLIHIQDLFKGDPVFFPIEPKTFIEDILVELKQKYKHRDFELETHIDTVGFWKTDNVLARMIIEQLVENALIFCQKDKKAIISLKFFHEEDATIIDISDEGTGIQPQHIDRIFEPFFKGSEESKGSGMGLFMVKKAVFQLNGKMEVNSTPNRGSQFRIILPEITD